MLQSKIGHVISSINLNKFIKDFDLMGHQGEKSGGNFITSLRLRQDVPTLIKLINALPNECHFETKQAELAFDGFVEFLTQFMHYVCNIGLAGAGQTDHSN